MTSLRPEDDEHALRLLHESWVLADGRVRGVAFHSDSVFLEERLPSGDGNLLHVGQFASYGRARLDVGRIRSTSRIIDGNEQRVGFDLRMTGSAAPPLEKYGKAHAQLEGPTGSAKRRKAAEALADQFNKHGNIEKMPEP